jgi:hypothetical protein
MSHNPKKVIVIRISLTPLSRDMGHGCPHFFSGNLFLITDKDEASKPNRKHKYLKV